MADRTCIVTGANDGIGFETARLLVAGGARVGLVCRDPERTADARNRLARGEPGARIDLFRADVSSLASIRLVTEEIRERYGAIDLLVNNAGAVFARRTFSVDGVEMHLATNFLGHFLLTVLLMDRLIAADPGPGRVVNLGSVLHRIARWPRGRVDFPSLYHLVPAYGRSKLAIAATTHELARRTAGLPIRLSCVDPGLTSTKIELGAGPIQQAVGRWFRPLAQDASAAAEAVVLAADDDRRDATSGIYFVRDKATQSVRRARRGATGAATWSWACEWLTDAERHRFESMLALQRDI